ncbi:MAG: hypothetical protein ABL966_10260 [Acidimicrobiales bacterium]
MSVTHHGETVVFPWGDYRNAKPPDSWWMVQWGGGRIWEIGIGLYATGTYAQASSAIRRRTRTIWSRWDQWFTGYESVPLYPLILGRPGGTADLVITQVLCELLAEHPELRPRLGERPRVERLIADMTSIRHSQHYARTGGRRRTVEVLTSMRVLGYVHHHGRPLPDGTTPTTEDVTARVLAHVRRNRFAQGLDITEEFVRDIVEHDYTGVAPWPLRALYN